MVLVDDAIVNLRPRMAFCASAGTGRGSTCSDPSPTGTATAAGGEYETAATGTATAAGGVSEAEVSLRTVETVFLTRASRQSVRLLALDVPMASLAA